MRNTYEIAMEGKVNGVWLEEHQEKLTTIHKCTGITLLIFYENHMISVKMFTHVLSICTQYKLYVSTALC